LPEYVKGNGEVLVKQIFFKTSVFPFMIFSKVVNVYLLLALTLCLFPLVLSLSSKRLFFLLKLKSLFPKKSEIPFNLK